MLYEGEMELITLKEVESTNNYVKNNLEFFSDRTVLRALRQTAGKGRLNRSWVDLGEGNLFFSIVLKPSDKFCDIYANLTQYMSVVLCELLDEYGLMPQIKWPNDVLIDGKKIAGILSETVMQGANFKGLILGVGINLNAELKDVSAIPDKIITALNLELSKKIDADEFLNKLLDKFFSKYDEFLEKGFEFIKSDYIKRACFLDKEVCVQLINETKHGIAKSVNKSGELILEDNGKEFSLTIGDIL